VQAQGISAKKKMEGGCRFFSRPKSKRVVSGRLGPWEGGMGRT